MSKLPSEAPQLTTTRARHEEISGLNRTAFDLAVYASVGVVTHPLRKTRFRLLVRLYQTG